MSVSDSSLTQSFIAIHYRIDTLSVSIQDQLSLLVSYLFSYWLSLDLVEVQ